MSLQSSDDLQPIINTKFPDKPEIIQTKFYDYNIRYLNDKTGKKFLVTDLLDQYAKYTNTPKARVNNYLRNEDTLRFIDTLVKEHHYSDLSNGIKSTEEQIKRDILEKYSFEGYDLNISSEAYVMKEELLTDCLYWLDKTFAAKVTSFLSKLRNADNDYLKKQLEIEKKDNDKLRLVIDELEFKNRELTDVVNKLDAKNKELTSVNNELKIKNKELTDVNNELEIKNKELTNVNNELETKNNQLNKLTKDLNNKLSELNKVNEDLQSKLNKLNQVNEELERKTQELIQVRNHLRNHYVSPYKGTETWSVSIELSKLVKTKQIRIQLKYTNEATENIGNRSLRRSLFCLLHTPCGHDIRYYCLDEFQKILESYHGVKTTSRSYTMNLNNYLDTNINSELLDFDSCSYYDLKPKQELLTDLRDMIETAVKNNHWNDTRLLYMFS